MTDEERAGQRLAKICQESGGDPPDAIWFFCQDGILKKLTLEHCDPPCDHCRCGYKGWMDALAC